ncbi:L-threonylcarbamoyladenylate synthase [Ralstonia thomasii]|uniref:L-threonylcarbamoyladenylate synthase n=1 Tax=uncultured Ralstonia sp. TaxID=114715 RepID=UPI0026086F7D|nr:L-threonylcarbamoyladenylate synthase [uncultured Ralstonia sp.]
MMLHLTSCASDLAVAVDLLRAGELVALPTETVYGLAADATNADAVRAIFHAKGRPADHPLIVHIAAAEQLPVWADEVPEAAWRLASAFWPGPLTLVLPAAPAVSPLLTGGQTTIALRVPAHPVFQAVLRQFGRGLAAPSANPFGRISPTTAAHVQCHLAGRIAAVVDGGPCPVGIESTIVDLSGDQPRILRPGMIAVEAVAQHLPRIATTGAFAPRVPGTLASHYAPRKPCFRIPIDLHKEPFSGQRLGLLATRPVNWPVARFWPMPAYPEDYARVLYSTLHQADASDCDVLLIALPPDEPSWVTIQDRIRRATRSLDGSPVSGARAGHL